MFDQYPFHSNHPIAIKLSGIVVPTLENISEVLAPFKSIRLAWRWVKTESTRPGKRVFTHS